ncbi:glycosyltransferase family 2 protein [Leptospira gomenensis]|uniref:Glycosyltransferase family 2 protein n=1 Tax=Leptospira gomenensis TaxID=2484974 RepID=A0A5F1YTW2_9LEPT|nr:glycosyltransferase family A protein [Leptospira gomenensis]TGK30902.1 glycosyltransferase family 2 protein [Leptospira gomenensis]TGK32540.1 glycosyltransferase family 2 protein [Leptospira gomenensis]TGK45378.1 glycosyltransferase family 2 protein [Leptospira gomenensis]TGK60630.1 glycosyltransferase family 2 protein [Leptospira gomenensis]
MSDVTFLVPAFNAEAFIAECLFSIQKQTFTNWNAIVIDDGSADSTSEIVKGFLNDKRFSLHKNSSNLGLAGVRNLGIELTKGKTWIAWLDSDDIAHPQKLGYQIEFLRKSPNVGLLGTWVKTFGSYKVDWKYPVSDEEIRCRMMFEDPFATSSLIVKRGLLDSAEFRFQEEFAPAEDYDLWSRLIERTEAHNVPRFLTFYRIHHSNASNLAKEKQRAAVQKIQTREVIKVGASIPQDFESHRWISSITDRADEQKRLEETLLWIDKLTSLFVLRGGRPETIRSVVGEKWQALCYRSRAIGVRRFFFWIKTAKYRNYNILKYVPRFLLRVLLDVIFRRI